MDCLGTILLAFSLNFGAIRRRLLFLQTLLTKTHFCYWLSSLLACFLSAQGSVGRINGGELPVFVVCRYQPPPLIPFTLLCASSTVIVHRSPLVHIFRHQFVLHCFFLLWSLVPCCAVIDCLIEICEVCLCRERLSFVRKTNLCKCHFQSQKILKLIFL